MWNHYHVLMCIVETCERNIWLFEAQWYVFSGWKVISKVYTNNKKKCTPFGVLFLFEEAGTDRFEDLNATPRWGVARCGLDRIDTMICFPLESKCNKSGRYFPIKHFLSITIYVGFTVLFHCDKIFSNFVRYFPSNPYLIVVTERMWCIWRIT